MTIRELIDEILRFLEMAETEELDEQAVKDTFEGLSGEFEEKADAYAEVRSELKSDLAKLEAEKNRIDGMISVVKNNINRINNTLMWAMETTGKTKFKTQFHSFGIAKNGGFAPIEIFGFVPEEFTKVEITNDTDKIREYLTNHPDCVWARLGERGTHLNLR